MYFYWVGASDREAKKDALFFQEQVGLIWALVICADDLWSLSLLHGSEQTALMGMLFELSRTAGFCFSSLWPRWWWEIGRGDGIGSRRERVGGGGRRVIRRINVTSITFRLLLSLHIVSNSSPMRLNSFPNSWCCCKAKRSGSDVGLSVWLVTTSGKGPESLKHSDLVRGRQEALPENGRKSTCFYFVQTRL